MDNLDRLEEMLKGTHFISFPDLTSEDPMKDLEDRNNKEWERLGEEKTARFWDLLWAIVADKLQPLAQEKYGNTGDSAVRDVLQEILNETLQELESEQQWQFLMQISKDLFVNEEQITPEQAEQLIKSCFVDYSVDFFADGVKRWELLPRSTASETVHVLARMFKEVAHADCR